MKRDDMTDYTKRSKKIARKSHDIIYLTMKTLERKMKALANGRRMAIVRHLAKHKSATVGEIARSIKLSFKATSKHLGILYAAELIDREQSSLLVRYFLPSKLHPLTRFISNSPQEYFQK